VNKFNRKKLRQSYAVEVAYLGTCSRKYANWSKL